MFAMHQVFRALALTALIALAPGCGEPSVTQPLPSDVLEQTAPPLPLPPQVGDIDTFHACKALPERPLSRQEQCLVSKLRGHCTPAADCVLTCLASPDGPRVGGGCDHVCFGYYHAWADRPKAMDECRDPQHG